MFQGLADPCRWGHCMLSTASRELIRKQVLIVEEHEKTQMPGVLLSAGARTPCSGRGQMPPGAAPPACRPAAADVPRTGDQAGPSTLCALQDSYPAVE